MSDKFQLDVCPKCASEEWIWEYVDAINEPGRNNVLRSCRRCGYFERDVDQDGKLISYPKRRH